MKKVELHKEKYRYEAKEGSFQRLKMVVVGLLGRRIKVNVLDTLDCKNKSE